MNGRNSAAGISPVGPRAAPAALRLTCEPITSSGAAAAWREVQGYGERTPFETWTWISELAHLQDCAEFVLTASIGDRPVAMLALERTPGPAGLRRLGLAGSRLLAPDHLDVVAAPEWAEPAARAFIDWVRADPGWDLLELDGLPANGALARALDRLSGPRFRRLAPVDVPCPYVRLGKRDETAARFSRNLRYQVRRGLRQVERTGGQLDPVTRREAVQSALDTLMDLHNARFGARSSAFDTPGKREFHRRLCGELAARGMARIYRLADGSRDLALLYALDVDDRRYYYSMGLRTDVGGSPGLTLLGQVILASADEGFTEFDLLRGDHPFKMRFATDVRHDVRHRIVRLGVRSGVKAARHLFWRTIAGDQPADVSEKSSA